jgi:opacity protein-like surface antigen
MLRAIRTCGILLAAIWLASCADAQNPAPAWQYKVEAFGNIAHGRFYNGSHIWGKGLDYGGGVGIRPFSGWLHRFGFEFQLARLKKADPISARSSQDLSSRLVMGNVVFHFRNGEKMQPFVFGGLGHVSVDYTSRCTDCVFDVDPVTGKLVSRGVTVSRTQEGKTGLTFGAGLKIAPFKHLSIRPELLFVDTTPGSGANWGWVRIQIGLGVHF